MRTALFELLPPQIFTRPPWPDARGVAVIGASSRASTGSRCARSLRLEVIEQAPAREQATRPWLPPFKQPVPGRNPSLVATPCRCVRSVGATRTDALARKLCSLRGVEARVASSMSCEHAFGVARTRVRHPRYATGCVVPARGSKTSAACGECSRGAHAGEAPWPLPLTNTTRFTEWLNGCPSAGNAQATSTVAA
jgi:hypothetical protein